MSKHPLAATAEGMSASAATLINPVVNPAPLAGLSIAELCGLSDAIRTLRDVTAGLLCQPRFDAKQRNVYNEAGEQLDLFQTALSDCLTAIRKEAEGRTAADAEEAETRAGFIIADEAAYRDDFENLFDLTVTLRLDIAEASSRKGA